VSFAAEARRLASLAIPVCATQVGSMLLGLVDTILLGRLSVDALAAAALANVWIWGTLMFANGVVFGIDPLIAQAHGAGDGPRAARALQQGIVLSLALSIPVALLWAGTDHFLVLAGQDPELARAARTFTVMQIPSIPCFLAYSVLRQYLQGRELVRPALWIMLVANLFNAAAGWILIFGELGAPALGIAGAGIATALTRALSLLGLVLWVRAFALHRGAWVPWSRAAWSPSALRAVLAIGIPVAVQISLEIWAFSGAALLAGRLGAEAVAAHTIALNLAALAFMMPLGIAQGAVVRVGNLIGARDLAGAQRAAWVALALGAGVMTVSAAAFVVLRHELPRIYTPDAALATAAAAVLPIAAAFQIFDGTQVVGCGVLRGMGRTRPAAVFNLIGYWVLGLPFGAWLAFRAGMGLAGIWWGLAAGLAVVALSLVAWVRWRGPATLEAASP
jgi:MATE family multidrug resistance protein